MFPLYSYPKILSTKKYISPSTWITCSITSIEYSKAAMVDTNKANNFWIKKFTKGPLILNTLKLLGLLTLPHVARGTDIIEPGEL